jgi:alcohol dehydrogenase (cytochrome c)
VIAALLAILAAPLALPQVRWRAEAIWLLATGRIPDLEMGELLSFLRPGSEQKEIRRILSTRNPYAVIQVPASAKSEKDAGAVLFHAQCASCHGPDGDGGDGDGPALFGREFKHGTTDWAIYRTIRLGVPNSTMPPHPLPSQQLWELVAHIRSLDIQSLPARPAPELLENARHVSVSAAELNATTLPSDDWLTYSGSYSSVRHSALTQIDASNVERLAVRWIHQFEDVNGRVECSPLVRNGVMFVTLPRGRILALDAASGRKIWTHVEEVQVAPGGEGPGGQNRGVALLGDRVFYGTWDGKLLALSAATGQVLWRTQVITHYPSLYISGAPLAFGDLVVTGVGTSKSGGRGFIAAYDAKTGQERWRFMAIPGKGEAGNDSWSGDSWRTGGAGTWMTGAYDPAADLLYWGVGNPKPDFDTSRRKGDNLYTNSVVALRGATGQLVWHFQFTPHDTHDWDSNQVPIIADSGTQRRLLWANRNGFYYVLDRDTGKFLRGVPFAQQNWAERLDDNGRPVELHVAANVGGQVSFPGGRGGTNWWPPSFDPQLQLVFVPVLEQGMVFFPTPHSRPKETGSAFYTAVRALDASTGRLVWEHRYPSRVLGVVGSGLLSTRGGVVFASDGTTFGALEAKSGRPLWSIETGGLVAGAPVTYSVNGEQFVTVPTGASLLTFALPAAASR